jgi:hypothetical protein
MQYHGPSCLYAIFGSRKLVFAGQLYRIFIISCYDLSTTKPAVTMQSPIAELVQHVCVLIISHVTFIQFGHHVNCVACFHSDFNVKYVVCI